MALLAQGQDMGFWRRLTTWKSFWPLVALALLLAFNAARFRSFVYVQNGRLFGTVSEVLQQGSCVMLLAVGMTLVIATAGIDLSVGSVMAMAGAVAALVLTKTVLPLAGVVVFALGVALVAGLWNGILVAFLRLQPIIATLVLLVAGRGVAQLLTGGQIITFQNPAFQELGSGVFTVLPSRFGAHLQPVAAALLRLLAGGGFPQVLPNGQVATFQNVFLGQPDPGFLLALPFPVLIVAVVAAATLLVTKTTIAGLYIEAVGDNERAARLSGIRPGLVKLLVYGFCGLCAGVAGLIETSYIKAADVIKCGEYIELDAILAVVIGGTSFSGGRANILGSIVGALVMQALTTTITMLGIRADYTLVVKAIIVVGVCLLQSEGLRATLGRAVARSRGTP